MTAPRDKPNSPEDRIAELKVELVGSEPPIWRRVQVPAAFTLGDLHHLIQIVMGWDDAHLHRFQVGSRTFVTESPWIRPPSDQGDEDADDVTLWSLKLAVPGRNFEYLYDFGDHWLHRITIERALQREPAVRYPRCADGERIAPPEDSGGVYRYAYLLEALADPEHAEHDDALEWFGEGFDPDALDLDRINERLERAFRG
jgi:hypothetical protein